METSAASVDAEPSAAPEPAKVVAGSPVAIIEALYERRHEIRTLLVATIDEEQTTEVVWNRPATPSHLSHLMRIANVKLDRLYTRGMYPAQEPAGPVAGVQGNNRATLPPAIQRQVAKAQKRIKKAQRQDKILNPHRKPVS